MSGVTTSSLSLAWSLRNWLILDYEEANGQTVRPWAPFLFFTPSLPSVKGKCEMVSRVSRIDSPDAISSKLFIVKRRIWRKRSKKKNIKKRYTENWETTKENSIRVTVYPSVHRLSYFYLHFYFPFFILFIFHII